MDSADNEREGEGAVPVYTDESFNSQERPPTGSRHNENRESRDNPAASSSPIQDEQQEIPWYANPYQLTAMLANFSTSYNVANISLVVPILEQLYDTNKQGEGAVASSLLAGMIVGELIGGVLGDIPRLGRLGALRLVMFLQIVASFASAFCSGGTAKADGALSNNGSGKLFAELAVVRLLLGVGAGGVYPLAAVLSAEQGGRGHSVSVSLHRAVLTFSTQGVGFIFVPIVTVILLYTVKNLDLVWRIILGLGSVPGLFLVILQWRVHDKRPTNATAADQAPSAESDEITLHARHVSRLMLPETDASTAQTDRVDVEDNKADNPNQEFEEIEPSISNLPVVEVSWAEQSALYKESWFEQSALSVTLSPPPTVRGSDHPLSLRSLRGPIQTHYGLLDSIRHEEYLLFKLLGTAVTWFLFDCLFYGNTLFQHIVIQASFNQQDQSSPLYLLQHTALDSLLLTSIALPGYLVASKVLGTKTCGITQTPRYVMLQGFAGMATLYLVIGLSWTSLRRVPVGLVILYGLTFFFANYGPNTTTFVLPTLVFSPECRTTLNGVSAAAGKMGALVGALLFAPAAERFGDATVMIVCSVMAVVAFILTFFFVHVRRYARKNYAASVTSSHTV